MKSVFTYVFLSITISNGIAQNISNVHEEKPDGMVFVPQGSFVMQLKENGISKNISISLDAFWISNEITNREFREFYLYAIDHPNDTLVMIDLKKMAEDRNNRSKKLNHRNYLIRYPYAEIADEIIDKSQWNPFGEDTDGKDYFLNEKYDDYPVAGVTLEGARLYCLWKTDRENTKLSEQGKPLVYDYRIPLETEWAYAASFKPGKCHMKNKKLNPVNKGNRNKLKIYNLEGNLSEWTVSSSMEGDVLPGKVVRGGSWKKGAELDKRIIVDPGSGYNYIGFRIVRSYRQPLSQ